MEEKTVRYFDEPGDANTAHCLNIARAEAEDNGYKYIIVASTTGETGTIFAEGLKGMDVNLMVVTYADDKGQNTIPEKIRQRILDNGATLFNAPRLSLLIDKAFGDKYGEQRPSKIVSDTLSRFGQGLTACCECVMSATDGGLLQEGMEIIAVAGTVKGADTVTVIKAASSKRFQKLKVLEILAKPRA
ncbi:hypothetical protein ACFL4R_00850 [Nitrospirota bacterium]